MDVESDEQGSRRDEEVYGKSRAEKERCYEVGEEVREVWKEGRDA